MRFFFDKQLFSDVTFVAEFILTKEGLPFNINFLLRFY